MFAWDDLRLVLAISRSGNLAAAAGTLGVNHSTTFRRLNALEKEIGAKLFERLPQGYRPTGSGTGRGATPPHPAAKRGHPLPPRNAGERAEPNPGPFHAPASPVGEALRRPICRGVAPSHLSGADSTMPEMLPYRRRSCQHGGAASGASSDSVPCSVVSEVSRAERFTKSS